MLQSSILLLSCFTFTLSQFTLLDVLEIELDCSGNVTTWNWNPDTDSCEQLQHSGCGFRDQMTCLNICWSFCKNGEGLPDPNQCPNVEQYIWSPDEQECVPIRACGVESDSNISKETCLEVKDLICLKRS